MPFGVNVNLNLSNLFHCTIADSISKLIFKDKSASRAQSSKDPGVRVRKLLDSAICRSFSISRKKQR